MQNSNTCSCHYHNDCLQLIILRCIDSGDFFLEKMILPYEDWYFESPPDSRVEIWTYGQGGVKLLHVLNARELQIPDATDPEWGLDPQRPVRSGLSRRGLQDGLAGSPSTEVAVPC